MSILKRFSSLTVACLLLSAGVGAQPSAMPLPEYQVKAALLYKLTKFVKWPASAFDTDAYALTICVLGDDPFGPALDKFAGELVSGRKVAIDRIANARAAADHCHVLFISRFEVARLEAALDYVRDAQVLTIGDVEDFAALGGMLELGTEENRIRFKINLDASKAAGIEFGAQLLQLATIVRDVEGVQQ